MLGGLGAVAVKTAGLAVNLEMRSQKTERGKGPVPGQAGQNGTELIHSEVPKAGSKHSHYCELWVSLSLQQAAEAVGRRSRRWPLC